MFKINIIKYLIYILFIISNVYLGTKSFYLWSQVIELSKYPLLSIDIFTHAHFLRYLITWPIFIFSDFTNIET